MKNRPDENMVKIALFFEEKLGFFKNKSLRAKIIISVILSTAIVCVGSEPKPAFDGEIVRLHVIANSAKWRSRPLQILDCSTMQDSLIEAELFGSYPSKKGLVETVQDGIVYLDSIGLIGQSSRRR